MNDQPKPATDLLEWAWAIIANAGGGDWTKESKEWQDAATRWRDDYHNQPKPATRHHKDAPEGYPCSCGRPVDDPIHLPSVQPKPAHPLGATHVREYLGHGKYRDVPIEHQPKPASGERWTQDALILRIAELEQQLAAERKAHKAAYGLWQLAEKQLAAAQGKRGFDRMDMPAPHPLAIKVAQLEQQLAAFREGKARCEKQLDATMKQLAAEKERSYKQGYGEAVDCNIDTHLTELREQLAAERKGHEMDGQLISSQESEIAQLREQLAAERERFMQAYRDATAATLAKMDTRHWIRAEDNPGFHRHE